MTTRRWHAAFTGAQEHAFDVEPDADTSPRTAFVSACRHKTALAADLADAPERPDGDGCALCRRADQRRAEGRAA